VQVVPHFLTGQQEARGKAVSQFDLNKAAKAIRGVHEAGFENLQRLFGR
jgi:hypothetical protein